MDGNITSTQAKLVNLILVSWTTQKLIITVYKMKHLLNPMLLFCFNILLAQEGREAGDSLSTGLVCRDQWLAKYRQLRLWQGIRPYPLFHVELMRVLES